MNRRKLIRNGGIMFSGLVLGAPFLNRFTTSSMVVHPQHEIITTQIGGIKVHAITSGLVKVKSAHKNPSLGFPAILLDPCWTDWLPIHTWVIEHPEGNILIDTGENVQVNDKDYFACDRMNGTVYRSILKFNITQNQELPASLSAINLQPEDIRWVILTHLHLDHVDGIQFFPQAEFVVAKQEYRTSSPGHVPCLLPAWFQPREVSFATSDVAGLDGSFALTKAKDVLIVPTPGHTYGHQSVILRGEKINLFFAGDATFTQTQLLQKKVAGICADKQAARKTIESIRAFGAESPMVFLPSHDPESAKRLKNLEVFEG
ncbi:MAG: N-acyl homoserine lactonase family protein [Bacteroidota bacterium]